MKHRYLDAEQRGFSMVELVVVLILAGIVAAVAAPRLFGRSGFEERALRDQTVAALRYAQKTAIAARRVVCVDLSVANQIGFAVSAAYPAANCATGAPLVGPDGKVLSVKAAGTETFTATANTLMFDAAGQPSTGLSIAVGGLPVDQAIVVQAGTGYVR